MGKQPQQSRTREIWAIALVGAALLLFLSLVSHNPSDFGNSARSGSHPVSNVIGPVGAAISFTVFQMFGFGGYFLMLVLAGLGIVLLLGQEVPWRSKVGAGVLLVVAASVLLDLVGLHAATKRWNLPDSAGGFVGLFIGSGSKAMVGTAGTTIVFLVLYLISLIILINLRPSYWVMMAADAARDGWRKMRGKPSVKEELRDRERDLRLQERELDRELSRKEREAIKLGEEEDLRPRAEPVIKDVSVLQKAKAEAKVEPEKEKPKAPSFVEKITAAAEKAVSKKESEPVPVAVTTPVAVPSDILKPATPVAPKPKVEKPVVPAPVPVIEKPAVPYQLPPLSVLNPSPDPLHRGETVVEDLKQSAEILRSTLEEFGITADVTNVTKGPVVTLYEMVPAPGVKVEKISALSNNIALAMKAVSIRILTPVPGKGTVGIEVPNLKSTLVFLRDILESEEWKRTKARLPIALGRDVAGNIIIGDLADMPHMLIAGATGSGKTVCVNSILASLLFRFTPDELRLVLVDPKMVEMHHYNAAPHLVVPVVTEAKKVTLALRWCISEMEKRFQILAKAGVRNITAFNNRPKPKPLPVVPKPESDKTDGEPAVAQEELKIEVPREDDLIIPERLPYIVVVIDELADLMQQAGADIENAIARLTALSRAVGIHLVLATQRPSVNVITGVIKANTPARVAFQVASKQDSRVILDANGADKLLGKGDMLYLPGSSKLIRAQGVLVLEEEIQRLLDHVSKQGEAQFIPEIHSKISKKMILPSDMTEDDAEDEALVEQSIEVIRQTNRASVSILQRRLRIGYTRAARIMDLLEERGIVGAGRGAEPRDILIDLDRRVENSEAEQA